MLSLVCVYVLLFIGTDAAPKPKAAPQYGDWFLGPERAPMQYGDWFLNPTQRAPSQYGDWFLNPTQRAPMQYGDWYLSPNRDQEPIHANRGKGYCCGGFDGFRCIRWCE